MSIEFVKKGRTGNNLFQYFISRILADKFKLNFKTNFYSPVLDFKPLNTYNTTSNEIITVNDTNIYQIFNHPENFENKSFIVEGYFQDSLFFNNKYHQLLDYIYLKEITKNDKDIVLHLRINDFNRDGDKSNVIHPRWYTNILDNESFEKLYIVIDTNARKKYNYSDKEQNYLNYFSKYDPIIINNTEREDFDFIRSFSKIISSNSTFSWWASYFSDSDTLYTPTTWRGKKKLSNILDKSHAIDSYTCDIHILSNPNNLTNSSKINTYNTMTTNFIKRDHNCVIVLSNQKYFEKCKNTIKLIRDIGKWTGDLVFVYGDDITIKNIQEIQKYCIIPKYFPDLDLKEVIDKLNQKPYKGLDFKLRKMFCFHKFYLFDTYFKNWNKVFYIDCGMKIYNPIQPLFDTMCKNNLLANSDAQPTHKWKLSCQFNSKSYPEVYKELENEFELDIDYFQSTILLYNTKIIKEDTRQNLINLLDKYFIGFTNDQAIMNLYFNCQLKIWKQVPLKKKDMYFYDYKIRKKNSNYIMTKI